MTITSAGSAVTSISQGTVVTLTATVLAGSTPVTAGQVNFCDATTLYCTDIHLLATAQLTSAGTAVLKFRPGPGSHSYKAVFIGTTTNAGSASAVSPLSVSAPTKLPTTTSIAQNFSGGSYTLTSTVGGNGSMAPTGLVSFLDTSNGNAVVGTASLGAGAGFGFVNSLNVAIGAGGSGLGIAVSDFNGDGIPDLAMPNYQYNSQMLVPGDLTVLLGNGDGTFTPVVASPATGIEPDAIAVGDFNRDGISDVVVVNQYESNMTVLLGNGDGTFTPTAPLTGVYSRSIAVGDFNQDGNLDLAVANQKTQGAGDVMILLGNGNGTFTPAPESPATGNGPSIAVGDFNGDNLPDLAVLNYGTYGSVSTVTILLGNGDGTFTATATSPATGIGGYAIAAGDFNGDGNLDLATANNQSNTVTILLGDGHGNFTPAATSPATGIGPTSIAVGDFNGDSIADLAVGNTGVNGNSNTATVLLGNGDGTFTATANSVVTGVYPEMVAVGDFNGDGLSDLAAQIGSGNTQISAAILLASTQVATATATGITLDSATHVLDASYPGDTNYASSVSQTTTINGPPAATTLALNVTPSGSIPSVEPITLTATLSPYTLLGQSTDGEPITFYNGTTALGTGTLADGTATLNFTPQATSAYSLSAGYSGDAHFAASTSITIPLEVVGPPTATTLTVNVNPSTITYGGTATISATLTPSTWQGQSAAGGTVTFTNVNNSMYLGTGTLSTSGVATITTPYNLPAGTYQIQAYYAGNTVSFNPSTSPTVMLTVNKATPTVLLTALPNPAAVSSQVSFAATLSFYNGTPQSELVAFYDGTTQLGLGQVLLGQDVAYFPISSLTAGSHVITAVYQGDLNYTQATSNALTETIESFTLGSSGGGTVPAQTASPGGKATYALAVDPPSGTTFPEPVTFAVTGLPAGATATFSPATVPANSGPTNVTMTVTLPSQSAATRRLPNPFGGGELPMALGMILLPFAGRMRKGARRWKGIAFVVLLGTVGVALLAGLSGCGSGGSGSSGGGSSPQSRTYTLTITATSGSQSQSTTTSLIVE